MLKCLLADKTFVLRYSKRDISLNYFIKIWGRSFLFCLRSERHEEERKRETCNTPLSYPY